MNRFHLSRHLVLASLLPGLALAEGSTVTLYSDPLIIVDAASTPSLISAVGDPRDSVSVFGGYHNTAVSLRTVASDGNGRYVVGGTTGDMGYVGLYNSGDHSQICENPFVPVSAAHPDRLYGPAQVFGIAFGNTATNGGFYAVGQAQEMNSANAAAFVQRFDDACQKVDMPGPILIDDPGRHALNAVAVNSNGNVFVAGYYFSQREEYLAEQWSPTLDQANPIFDFFYPVSAAKAGNRWYAIAADDAGNSWTAGYIKRSSAPTAQLMEINALMPDGHVRGNRLFTYSDSGPSLFTTVKLGGDGLLYATGTIVDSHIPDLGPHAGFVAGLAIDFTGSRCFPAITNTTGASGLDIDSFNDVYLSVFLDSSFTGPPNAFFRAHGVDCQQVEANQFGGTGTETPGAVSFDALTSVARIVGDTSSPDFAPITDGSSFVLPGNGALTNGYTVEFGNFAP